jgi:hypothetical protein
MQILNSQYLSKKIHASTLFYDSFGMSGVQKACGADLVAPPRSKLQTVTTAPFFYL